VKEKKKIKGSLYYPEIMYKALKLLYAEDEQNRRFNDVVIELLADHPKVKAMINRMQPEESDEK
jgi:hypothetical protein